MKLENDRIHTLYLCYFGLREPLVQTQVLPYLRQMSKRGISVSLLTFEPDERKSWTSEQAEEWRGQLRSDGVNWYSLSYHKRPSLPATLYDIAAGARFASRLMSRQRIDILHGRAHVAAAMGALARRISASSLRREGRTRPRLLFDIRGFVPEEYVDAGVWPAGGLNYRLLKLAERQLLAEADGYVVLTERAREILFPDCSDTDTAGRPIEVIPCCVDWQRFDVGEGLKREEVRRTLGVAGRRVLVYVGALGGWYLTDEMARFMVTAHRNDPSVFSLILTQSPSGPLLEQLLAGGMGERDCLIRQVSPEQIPRYLAAADLALSFIKPCFSKLSSSPTKMAEYLASGLPVICNGGIGDVDGVVTADRVGVMVRDFSPEAYDHALSEAELLLQEPGIAARCRAVAQDRFHLQTVGGARYRRLYHRLVEDGRAPEPMLQ